MVVVRKLGSARMSSFVLTQTKVRYQGVIFGKDKVSRTKARTHG